MPQSLHIAIIGGGAAGFAAAIGAKRLGVKIQCNHQLTAITELEDECLLLDFKISKEKGNLSGASSASHHI